MESADHDYWLGRCEGFRVDSPDGRIGFVEHVRFGPRHGRPEVLAVRAGRLGRRVLIVSVSKVAEIVPSRERIVLSGSPELLGTEPAIVAGDVGPVWR